MLFLGSQQRIATLKQNMFLQRECRSKYLVWNISSSSRIHCQQAKDAGSALESSLQGIFSFHRNQVMKRKLFENLLEEVLKQRLKTISDKDSEGRIRHCGVHCLGE